MKVAIPIFGSRVSPRFDCSNIFLIISIEENKVQSREKVIFSNPNPIQKVDDLANMGIDTVICAGLNEFSYQLFLNRGLKVIPWVTGNVDEIIDLLLKKELKSGITLFPDGRKIFRKFRRFRHKYGRKFN